MSNVGYEGNDWCFIKKKLIIEDSFFFYYEGSVFMLMFVFKWKRF